MAHSVIKCNFRGDFSSVFLFPKSQQFCLPIFKLPPLPSLVSVFSLQSSAISDHTHSLLSPRLFLTRISLSKTLKIPNSPTMPPLSPTHFHKGDQVEVIKQVNGPNTLTYYAATVLRSPAKRKTQILIEYHTLMMIESGTEKRITELIDFAYLRPMPPKELNKRFKMGDSVDVFCDNGWQKGTVKNILENSNYVVGFDGKSEGIVAEQCNLRLHREWDDGSWVPPLIQYKISPAMDMKSRKITLKIKCRERKSEPTFRMGTRVEVKTDEEGYIGAWYSAIIIGIIGNDRYMVQYLNLLTDDETAPLREVVTKEHVRPCPPPVPADVHFKQFEKVDAWFNEGWWEGEVSRVVGEFKYMVYFSSTSETVKFDHSALRHHQEWISGAWIKVSLKSQNLFLAKDQAEYDVPAKSIKLEDSKRNPKTMFSEGTMVEVKSDEVGFQGAWFAATVIDEMGSGKFVVQYQNLLTEDGNDFLREEVNASDIRPTPPQIQHLHPFKLFETVDAWYNDGWWVGRISRVHMNSKYTVHFKTREELEFEQCELRPHQEYIDGCWVTPPMPTKSNVRYMGFCFCT